MVTDRNQAIRTAVSSERQLEWQTSVTDAGDQTSARIISGGSRLAVAEAPGAEWAACEIQILPPPAVSSFEGGDRGQAGADDSWAEPPWSRWREAGGLCEVRCG